MPAEFLYRFNEFNDVLVCDECCTKAPLFAFTRSIPAPGDPSGKWNLCELCANVEWRDRGSRDELTLATNAIIRANNAALNIVLDKITKRGPA